jgi:hypothetical protein
MEGGVHEYSLFAALIVAGPSTMRKKNAEPKLRDRKE